MEKKIGWRYIFKYKPRNNEKYDNFVKKYNGLIVTIKSYHSTYNDGILYEVKTSTNIEFFAYSDELIDLDGNIVIKNYGFSKDHNPRSISLFKYIENIDFKNGDRFYFKSGGDGDNGEFLMDLFDEYFKIVGGNEDE